MIVTLGLPSAKYMLASKLSMGRLRGQWHNWRGIKLMPTYHPAFLLRAYTEENRGNGMERFENGDDGKSACRFRAREMKSCD